ncbi:sensor domain-containing protein [Halochromatium sp.]
MTGREQTAAVPGSNSIEEALELSQQVREALAAGRLDLAEAAFAERARDQDTLIESLRVYEAELQVQNQELRQSQTRIEEALTRFTAFFESLPIAELILDARGFVLEANAAAEALLALKLPHLQQHPLIRRIAEPNRARVIEALNQVLEARDASLNEVSLRGADGATVIADLHLARLPDGPEQTPQCVCALVDRREAVAQRSVLQLRDRALTERIKELDCLYDIAKLKLQHDVPRNEVLQQIVDRLPGGLQRPGLASACIELADQRFTASGFAASDHRIEATFTAPDESQGRIQVVYVEAGTEAAPAFLPEEQELVATVASHVETFLQRRQMQSALREAHEAYRVLAEYSPEWEYWLGPDGRYRYLSPACERITGYPPEAFQGESDLLAELIHPDDRAAYLAHRNAVLSPEMPGIADFQRSEFRFRAKSGAWIWLDHQCAPVTGEDGRWLGVRGCNRDITSRKQAEEQLQHSRWLLEQAERLAGLGAWEIDIANRRLTPSANWKRLHGATADSYDLETLIATYAHPDDRTAIEAAMERALCGDGRYQLEHRILRADDGRVRVAEVTGELIRDADGQPWRMVGVGLDVTERRQAEDALRQSEERLRLTLEATSDGLWDWDVRSGSLTVNDRLFEMLGFAPGELEPNTEAFIARFHPDDRDPVMAALERHLHDNTPYDVELRMQCKAGDWRWVHARGQVVARDDSGEALRVVGTNTDIDVRKRAEEQSRRAAQVFKSTADGVIITDASHQILAVNPAFTEITGYTEAEVVGAPLTQLQINAGREEVFAGLRTDPGQSGRWRGEVWKRRKDGEPFRARMAVTGVTSANGDLAEYVIVFSDITRLHRTEEQLDLAKNYDALTGLANRGQFRGRLQDALQRARRSRSQLAVLILDLDRFHVINESLGQAGADQLLVLIAGALTRGLRPSDTIARLGGDEFGLLLEPVASTHEVAGMASRLLALCAEPKIIDGETLVITASIGIALYPTDGQTGETLMRHADVALKQGKEQGCQSLQYFEAALAQSVETRLRLESGLRRALANHELELCYQPQVHLADRRLIGAEALLRWRSEQLGLVSPLQFIPIAEELGLIGEIGRWVLAEACEQLAAWDAAGLRLPRLAVNLSTLQLEQGDLVADIQRLLAQTGLDPARLELEVTESLIMRQADRAIASLHALRRIGVRLAVDDFGTGYSSLAYLRRLPIHQLKIDKSFVDDLSQDPQSQAIASAVIALGSSLDLEVLAEGVETQEQANWLLDAGCELGQGYLFDKALSAGDLVERWLGGAAATRG